MAPLLANLAAFCTAVGVSFLGHYHWTFAHKGAFHREVPGVGKAMRRFLIVSLIGLALNSLVVYVITDLLALSYWYAVVLMVTAVPGIVFLLSRFWAFRGPVRQAAATPRSPTTP
jgi:putative flippase GtrA